MHDLPTVTVQQQAHARPISGEDLEVLGKAAASAFCDGSFSTLDNAVVEMVKRAGLSPEQVKRVVEFTNVNAHLLTFKKEADHKVINFQGGPASPSTVLKDLNDGGGGTVFDRGTADYNYPPPDVEKTSSANMDRLGLDDAKLAEAFEVQGGEYAFADPLREAMDLRDKLAGARDLFNHELGAFETLFVDAGDLLYSEVKQASMVGTSLGQVVQAWSSVTDETEYVKLAFQAMTPRLLRDGVFENKDELSESISVIEKTAALVNPKHPLVATFVDYCDTLYKLAELRQARDEIDQHFDSMTEFIKGAGGALGLIPKVVARAAQASKPAARAGKRAGEFLLGEGKAADRLGDLAGKAVKYAPHAAGVVAAEEGLSRAKYNPWTRAAYNFGLARVPLVGQYTRPGQIRAYKLQHQY